VVAGDDQVLEQIQKQLYKLIDVIKVFDLPPEKSVDREAILIKVAINAQNRAEVTEVVELFSAKIVEATDDTLTIEALAESEKITGFIKMLKKFGIKEMVQTGKIALLKGESSKK
jgi:acetolactate synthase-1/3 small subunit